MAISLTEGAIEAMCNGNNELVPVLQVADIRLVNSQNPATSTTERYRLLLSDGVHLQQGMLTTQRNELVKSGRLQKGSVIQLTQAVCNFIQGRSIIIIIELEVIRETYPTIGEPKQYSAGGAKPTAQVPSSAGQTGMIPGNAQQGNPHPSGSGPTSRPSDVLQQPKLEYGAQMQSYGVSSSSNHDPGHYTTNNAPPVYPKPEFPVGNSRNSSVGGPYGGFNNAKTDISRAPPNTYARPQQPAYQHQPLMYTNRGPIAKNEAPPRIIPIAALNPYQGRWTIKARVTSKGELRRYNNPRGDGKVFSFDLLDSDGGEIRVTCFNAVADQFYDQIEVGRVYLISKGTLKPAQKTFNHLANDHEIFLDTTSVVQPCFDDDSRIPRQHFHFRPISDIEGMESNSVIDVIGIVFSISPSSSIMRKNGIETQKRTLHLKDMSGKSVELTLWGNFCNSEGQELQSMCDTGNFPVLAVKSGRVYEFNGKGVGTLSTSQLFIEPDFPEAKTLKQWFTSEGRNTPSISISRETTSSVKTDVRKTISQIKDEKLGTSEKPDWITVCATISFMKMDNFFYTACPILIGDRQCNKKVTNNGDRKWRCDRCDQSVDECDYRYILQFQISDHTGLTWVTAFQESGEEILKISAKDLFNLKYEEQDEEKFQEIIHNAIFSKYVLKLKVKEETFSDEQRVKSTVVKAERVNFATEFTSLLDMMEKHKTGGLGPFPTPKSENATPNIGINRSGIANVSYGPNTGLASREMGFSGNTTPSPYGNQYNGRYGGANANASGMYTISNTTCSSCGGIGHSSTSCPTIVNGPGRSPGPYLNQATPPAYGGNNVGPGRHSGVQRQYVGGF